jgi:proteasome lid subunit RPN8/RPN11
MKDWILPYREFRRLHSRAYRAQQRDQSEVVGVLLSGAKRRLMLSFLKNHSDRSGHFVVEMADIALERRRARSRRLRFVGLFHSHPVSEATLGPGDCRAATLNWLQLVYDVCGREARLWRVCRRAGRRHTTEARLRIERRGINGAS